MALPSSGLISLASINTEMGRVTNYPITLNDANVRALLGKTVGAISLADAYGKSSNPTASLVVGSSTSSGIYAGMTGLGYIRSAPSLVYKTMGFSPCGSITPTPFQLSGTTINCIFSSSGLGSDLTYVCTELTGNITTMIADGVEYALKDPRAAHADYFSYNFPAIPNWTNGSTHSISFR